MREIPLGKSTDYAEEYAPDLLFAVARADARAALGLGAELPFSGTDIWNAWELTWLDGKGKPIVATATVAVDAESLNIVESKSLKLYLNSFAMTRCASSDEVRNLITRDLSRTVTGPVTVTIATAAENSTDTIAEFPGTCIDDLAILRTSDVANAELLRREGGPVVSEALYSHLLRTNCPITDQPDMGSVLVQYEGPRIDRVSLLEYIVSFRQHNDFHEACVERMFLDIRDRCSTEKLTVYARYNRRGGLDINPFRTDAGDAPDNLRLWRQ